MISRTRPQQISARLPGSSPLRPLELPLKENAFPPNSIHPQPLISPKHQHSDRMNLPQKNHTYRQQPKSPHGLINSERRGVTGTSGASGASGTSAGEICCNHPSKQAEFRTFSEEGDQYFCGRCAAQLATQGYKVQPLYSDSDQSLQTSNPKQVPSLPQFQQQPIYHQIRSILQLCNRVIGDHKSNITRFANLEQEYSQQVDLTSAFYDRLIDVIEQMKADHLQDLLQERDKYTQIADIENDNIRENILEINTIQNDIEGNMAEVLHGIRSTHDDSECRESLDHYRQKLYLCCHQTEEQLDSLNQVTRYSQPQIDAMLGNFDSFLRTLWDEGTQQVQPQQRETSGGQAMTVKNIHQILPRGVAYENKESKRAFRNLQAEEEDEDEELVERKSPNFKRI